MDKKILMAIGIGIGVLFIVASFILGYLNLVSLKIIVIFWICVIIAALIVIVLVIYKNKTEDTIKLDENIEKVEEQIERISEHLKTQGIQPENVSWNDVSRGSRISPTHFFIYKCNDGYDKNWIIVYILNRDNNRSALRMFDQTKKDNQFSDEKLNEMLNDMTEKKENVSIERIRRTDARTGFDVTEEKLTPQSDIEDQKKKDEKSDL